MANTIPPKMRERMRALAAEMRASGKTKQATAKALAKKHKRPVSYGTVGNLLREWDVAAELAAEAPAVDPIAALEAEPPADAPPEPSDADLESPDALVSARALRAKMLATARAADRDQNFTAATRALTEAGKQQLLIARLEEKARERGGSGGVVLTDAELAAARKQIEDMVSQLRELPLCCARCGRELRIELAQKDEDGEKV